MDVIKGTIDRFEEGRAVIRTLNGETIIWPKILLQKNVKEGESVYLACWADFNDTEAKKKLAYDILNNILSNSR